MLARVTTMAARCWNPYKFLLLLAFCFLLKLAPFFNVLLPPFCFFLEPASFFATTRFLICWNQPLDYASLLPPRRPDAGISTIFFFHRSFGFAETNVIFCIFCYHCFVFCWNQRQFLLPPDF
ncbi:hypothetical protein VPH35_059706 [Triticum aestivum]